MSAMIISVEATTIGLTKAPLAAIEEGREAQYVCETDSAYPDSPSVLWYVDNAHAGINDEHTVVNKTLAGNYSGQKTISTLTLETSRGMNLKKVKCVLENDDTKLEERTLNIMCKYLLLHKYQKVDLKVFFPL